MSRAIANMLRLTPQSRLSAEDMLRSPEVVPKLHLDGVDDASDAILISHRENFPNLLETIKVPQNLRKLNGALPKPCYPDVRPNTPSAWILAEQYKKAGENGVVRSSRGSNSDRDDASEVTVDKESQSVDPREKERERRLKREESGAIKAQPQAQKENQRPPRDISRAASQAEVPPLRPQPGHGGAAVKLSRQASAPVVPNPPTIPSAPAPPDGPPSNRGRPVPGGYVKPGKPTRLW